MAIKKPDLKKMAKRSRRLSKKKGILNKSWDELMRDTQIERSIKAVGKLEGIRQ